MDKVEVPKHNCLMKIIILFFSMLFITSCASPAKKFQEKFEQIPIGSEMNYVEKSFGRPNMIKSHAEDKVEFESLIAYRIHGLFCIIYFDEGKTYEKGLCIKDDVTAERVQDTSPSGKAYRDVWVPINNNDKELTCYSFTDLFKVTYKSCE